MSFQSFMNAVRQWDYQLSRWISRSLHPLFFQVVLVIVFVVFFVNAIKVIDLGIGAAQSTEERLLLTHSVNSSIIVMLLLLNSFWMLYIFRNINRMVSVLKDVSFSLSRRRDSSRNSQS